jgi:hypothetical protein
MPAVAAVHHSLRDIDRSSGNVHSIVYIDNAANHPAVNTHTQRKRRDFSQRFADFQRALRGRFGAVRENQGHSITSRQSHQVAGRICLTELIALFYDAVERIKQFELLIDQQFRITDGIDEQNVPNFQFAFRFDFWGHAAWVARFIVPTQPAESTLTLFWRQTQADRDKQSLIKIPCEISKNGKTLSHAQIPNGDQMPRR